MRKVHGEYPFDRPCGKQIWTYVLQAVPKGVVDALLAEVPAVGDDDCGELPNKGFRVVRAEYNAVGGVVVAVYKHDDEYHLIQADEESFNEQDENRHAAQRGYRTPVERLPFPSL